MKNFTLLSSLVIASLLSNISFSQPKFLFDSTWYGFNTGTYPNGQSPSAFKTADLDNDGDSDIVVSLENFANGFVVLLNQGKGMYSAPIKFKSTLAAKDIVVADFNRDGRKDVALTNSGQNLEGKSVAVYLNTGRTFAAPVYYTVGAGPIGIIAADFDNDGDPDLAVANHQSVPGTVSVLINKGNGTFNAAVNFVCGDMPYKLSAGKINSDNLIDIVVGNDNQKMNILFNAGNNNFSNRVEKTVQSVIWAGDGSANVKVADFDNDGDNDIIYSSGRTWNENNGEIALFRNQGNGVFASPQMIELAPFTIGAIDMDVADFNNDGWMDIVADNYAARITDGYQVLLNNKSGGFLPAILKPAGQSTFGVAAADIDNDKKIDILTLDWYSLQVTVHKNLGQANFPVPVLYNTNNGVPGALDAADIDGDGDLDVVTSASSIAAVGVTVTVLKNNGNGTFSNAVAYSIRGGGVQAKFRDLNGDGKPDLLFATAISTPPYDFHTALNNGDGTFGPRQTWSMNACGWSDIDAFDLDNDGDKDVVVTEWLGCMNVDTSARRIYISKNNGRGGFGPPLIKLVNPFPSCLAGADLNKDGKIDLITGQSLSIDVHLGTGTGDIKPPVSYATKESPYDIILNDFNNDGNLDIAACTEYNSEGMSVLLGNGDGTFQPAQNYPGAYSPDLRNESGITSGDVDGDGDIDIIVGNAASNDVSVYLNKGNGTFTFKMRYGMYYGTAAPFYADFTGDGKKDILAAVALPPSGFQGAIALLKGTVLNAQLAAKSNTTENILTNTSTVQVLNNPFNNYIDVKLEKAISGKTILQLMDMQGRLVSTSQQNIASQSIIRFNLNNNISSGTYLLTVITDDKKHSVKVFKQ